MSRLPILGDMALLTHEICVMLANHANEDTPDGMVCVTYLKDGVKATHYGFPYEYELERQGIDLMRTPQRIMLVQNKAAVGLPMICHWAPGNMPVLDIELMDAL